MTTEIDLWTALAREIAQALEQIDEAEDKDKELMTGIVAVTLATSCVRTAFISLASGGVEEDAQLLSDYLRNSGEEALVEQYFPEEAEDDAENEDAEEEENGG
jgi:hypothetical protein